MFEFSNYSSKSNYYNNSNKSVVGKMKYEKGNILIEELFALNKKMDLYLIVDKRGHEKPKGVNKNAFVELSYDEFKDVLLNKKCLRYSMNRIQSKDYRIETYEIKNMYFSCLDYKIRIENNGCDGVVLGYQS